MFTDLPDLVIMEVEVGTVDETIAPLQAANRSPSTFRSYFDAVARIAAYVEQERGRQDPP